jgi:hypothetical protein
MAGEDVAKLPQRNMLTRWTWSKFEIGAGNNSTRRHCVFDIAHLAMLSAARQFFRARCLFVLSNNLADPRLLSP